MRDVPHYRSLILSSSSFSSLFSSFPSVPFLFASLSLQIAHESSLFPCPVTSPDRIVLNTGEKKEEEKEGEEKEGDGVVEEGERKGEIWGWGAKEGVVSRLGDKKNVKVLVREFEVDGDGGRRRRENEEKERFLKEVVWGCVVRHPNLYRCVGVGIWGAGRRKRGRVEGGKKKSYLFSPMYSSFSLLSLLEERRNEDKKERRQQGERGGDWERERQKEREWRIRVGWEVAKGMKCLHKYGIVHTNLHSGNIYFEQQQGGGGGGMKIEEWGRAVVGGLGAGVMVGEEQMEGELLAIEDKDGMERKVVGCCCESGCFLCCCESCDCSSSCPSFTSCLLAPTSSSLTSSLPLFPSANQSPPSLLPPPSSLFPAPSSPSQPLPHNFGLSSSVSSPSALSSLCSSSPSSSPLLSSSPSHSSLSFSSPSPTPSFPLFSPPGSSPPSSPISSSSCTQRPHYIDPSFWETRKYDFSSDIFSFGVLLWEIWYNFERGGEWGEEQEKEWAEKMLRGERPPLCPSCPFSSLIQKCWEKNCPSFVEVLAEYSNILEDEEKGKKKKRRSKKGKGKKRKERKDKGKEKESA